MSPENRRRRPPPGLPPAGWLVLAFVAAASGGACNCSSSVQTVKPALEVATKSIDFGLVAVGETSQPRTVNLQSATAAPVKLTQITVTTTAGGGNVFAVKGMAPTVVLSRETATLSLVFTPAAATTYAGELVIKSNDPNHPEVDILLSGQGATPQISVTPDHLGLAALACPANANMSPRCRDSTATQVPPSTVQIKNTGLVDLQLGTGGVYLAPAMGETSVPANLTLANQISTQTILPGDTATVDVNWAPVGTITNGMPGGEIGTFKATLVIKSDDPVHPEIDIPVTAASSPVGYPTACVNVLSVSQREYMSNPQGGQPIVQQAGVNPTQPPAPWVDPNDPTTIHVRPGDTVTLTSQRVKMNAMGFFEVDSSADQMNPCTGDPNAFQITRTWTLSSRPATSSAVISPSMGLQTQLTIDAAGQYAVTLHATNNLGLPSMPVTINIDAQPRDDLFAQLSWPDGKGIDLDLHLLVDQGPGISKPASLFCVQDCFFYNADPVWFPTPTGDETPHLLKDDEGSSGLFEIIDLIKAPANSTYRLAAHYWAQNGTIASTTPQLTITHQMDPVYGPYSPTAPLTMKGDAWFAVQVAFDDLDKITVTPLPGTIENDASTAPPDYTQPGTTVGMCP